MSGGSSGSRGPGGRGPGNGGEGADGVRLQKVLARAGVASRRGSEELIVAGRVQVNGRVVREMGVRVDPVRDEVRVDGRLLESEPPLYLVMNKPEGVVCSGEGPTDDRGRPTVLSLLRGIKTRVFPVGRLDFRSRGTLILTNDGDFSAALTHPRHAIPKTYHVKFQGQLELEELERLRQGVRLEDGTVTRPLLDISVVKDTTTNVWIQMTLQQGINRQIRRMGDAIGHHVLKIIRVAIGDLTADGLEDGQWRKMTETEVEQLRARARPVRKAGGSRRPGSGSGSRSR